MKKVGRPHEKKSIRGDRLATLIKLHGFNNSTFAEEVKISRPVIVEGTKHNVMTDDTLKRIAEYFDVHPDYLSGKINEKKPCEGTPGDKIIVDDEIRGMINSNNDIVLDADSYDEFMFPDDPRWKERFSKVNENALVLPSFHSAKRQKEKAMHELKKLLLEEPYMSPAWNCKIATPKVLEYLLQCIKDYGFTLQIDDQNEKDNN